MFVQVFIGITIYGLKNKCWAFFQAESLLNIYFTDNYKKSWETKVYARENMIALEMILANRAKERALSEKETRMCEYWRNKRW